MARKPDIQYIHQFYVYGSEAQVIELKPERKRRRAARPRTAPRQEKAPQILIRIDPVALCGLVVAVAMLILMAVGVNQYKAACEEHRAMEEQLIALQNQNAVLQQEYRAGYDLEEIEAQALALGLVPVEQVEHITISGEIPQPEPEPTVWENIQRYFMELFA